MAKHKKASDMPGPYDSNATNVAHNAAQMKSLCETAPAEIFETLDALRAWLSDQMGFDVGETPAIVAAMKSGRIGILDRIPGELGFSPGVISYD